MCDEFLLIVVTTMTMTSGLGPSFPKFGITVMPFLSSRTVSGGTEPVSVKIPSDIKINNKISHLNQNCYYIYSLH